MKKNSWGGRDESMSHLLELNSCLGSENNQIIKFSLIITIKNSLNMYQII